MLHFALKNLLRRPLRTLLTAAGLGVSVAALASLLTFSQGYQHSLRREIDGMGMQMMVVPLGCPYDAAARVLKGRSLDVTLPAEALQAVRNDPAVAIAAPLHMVAVPRPAEKRTDMWVGVDESIQRLKPWWRVAENGDKLTSGWLNRPDSVVLGAEAAEIEMRRPGDKLYSPETGKTLTVCGILERSGTSDDSLFFVPLATAQAMSGQRERLTAVAVRLKDPARVTEAAERLQTIPGAQVVTQTEMMGTFLNLLNSARTLVLALILLTVAISALSIFNTMMAAVLERTREIGVLRALGMSRGGAFGLMATEALLLALGGGVVGICLAVAGGRSLTALAGSFLPLSPEGGAMPTVTLASVGSVAALTALVGLLAGVFPAWQASRLTPSEAFQQGEG